MFEPLKYATFKNNMSVINKTMYSIYSVPIELNNKPETLFILSETKHSLLKKEKKHTHTDPRVQVAHVFPSESKSFENFGVQPWGCPLSTSLEALED